MDEDGKPLSFPLTVFCRMNFSAICRRQALLILFGENGAAMHNIFPVWSIKSEWYREHQYCYPVVFEKEIGGTVYTVTAHFNENVSEDVEEKAGCILSKIITLKRWIIRPDILYYYHPATRPYPAVERRERWESSKDRQKKKLQPSMPDSPRTMKEEGPPGVLKISRWRRFRHSLCWGKIA